MLGLWLGRQARRAVNHRQWALSMQSMQHCSRPRTTCCSKCNTIRPHQVLLFDVFPLVLRFSRSLFEARGGSTLSSKVTDVRHKGLASQRWFAGKRSRQDHGLLKVCAVTHRTSRSLAPSIAISRSNVAACKRPFRVSSTINSRSHSTATADAQLVSWPQITVRQPTRTG